MAIIYEWCYEITDKDGDIIDSNHATKLSEFSDNSGALVLVRNEGDEVNGLEGRYWAYVKDGNLPDYFEDSAANEINIAVPKRFKLELAKYLKP